MKRPWGVGYWICVVLVLVNGIAAYFAPEPELLAAMATNAGICGILALACWVNDNTGIEP